MWFKDTFILEISDGRALIGVPNRFNKKWLEDKYRPEILETLKKFLKIELKGLEFVVANRSSLRPRTDDQSIIPNADYQSKNDHNLSQDYTFETFIVGKNNRLAYAAAGAIAESPGSVYNPLYLYGGVGLGKTHLLHAIGQDIAKRKPGLKIIYASAESFTNEFVKALSTKKMEGFKNRYRNIDVFLVDDIQFIAGKEGTQEEFFHTFNTLHQKKRQIVLSSDRMPNKIPETAQRLTSRFGWGMVADLQPPDFETRAAILERKAEKFKIELPRSVTELIAERITSNIRDLEGALNRLISYHLMTKEPIDQKMAEENLEDFFIANESQRPGPEGVISVVSDYYQVGKDDLFGPKRTKEIVLPRQVLMYLLRNELSVSFSKIARLLGGKDHTTVIHGCQKIERESRRDRTLKKDLSLLKALLYQEGQSI